MASGDASVQVEVLRVRLAECRWCYGELVALAGKIADGPWFPILVRDECGCPSAGRLPEWVP